MKTFWELDEREQAALTDEQVRHYIDIELMSKGIEQPTPPPQVPEVKTSHPLRTVTLFAVGSILFDTAEQANAFNALQPKTAEYDYRLGYNKWKYPKSAAGEITPEVLYLAEDVAANSKALAEHEAKRDEIDKARTAYELAVRAAADAAAPIWKARSEVVSAAARHQHILDTYARYLSLADNDKRTAFRFLRQTFGEAETEAAFAWSSTKMPSLVEVDEAEPAMA